VIATVTVSNPSVEVEHFPDLNHWGVRFLDADRNVLAVVTCTDPWELATLLLDASMDLNVMLLQAAAK